MSKKSNATAAKIAENPAHGLLEPVIISTDSELTGRFLAAMQEVQTARCKNYQSMFNIQQNGEKIKFTSYFYDDRREYCMELSVENRVNN